jgi:hypothetical protein
MGTARPDPSMQQTPVYPLIHLIRLDVISHIGKYGRKLVSLSGLTCDPVRRAIVDRAVARTRLDLHHSPVS